MKRQEKRGLGLLPRQIYKCVKHLKKEGELTAEMDREQASFILLAHLADEPEYADAWTAVRNGTYGADWDAIFALIEKIIDLIFKMFIK